MDIFCRRGLVLYFSTKLRIVRDVAMATDAGFGYYAIDKLFMLVMDLLNSYFTFLKIETLFSPHPLCCLVGK